jgi:hypothetical protein
MMLLIEWFLSFFVAPTAYVQGEVPVSYACTLGVEANWKELGERIVVDYDYPGWYQLYVLPDGRYQLLVMYQNPRMTTTPHVSCFREFRP